MNAENIANPRITVNDLNFFYGKFRALKDSNLEMAEKKVTAFIGPSGCGKSTLLRTFNRMYQLYPNQTATGAIMLDDDNIAFGVKLYHNLSKNDMDERVEWALRKAALW